MAQGQRETACPVLAWRRLGSMGRASPLFLALSDMSRRGSQAVSRLCPHCRPLLLGTMLQQRPNLPYPLMARRNCPAKSCPLWPGLLKRWRQCWFLGAAGPSEMAGLFLDLCRFYSSPQRPTHTFTSHLQPPHSTLDPSQPHTIAGHFPYARGVPGAGRSHA